MSKTDSQKGRMKERGNLVPQPHLNTVEWRELNWRKIQKAVWKLQKRIYQAYISGDVRKGRRLQKTLISSYYNRLLSVRKVTQDNSGKKTAGVDQVKSLTPKQRFQLANDLKLGDKSQPIRRVWIPKPGRNEKRPLGIPVMRDRAAQALVKAALEPEWEAKFEGNSYGFRPGFDFLGFNVRQYSVGKYQSGRNTNGKILGFKTLIRPSSESVKRHYNSLSQICKRHNSAPQTALIVKLNPIIRGWCNYYKTVASQKIFSQVSHLTFHRLEQWAKRRHPNKPVSWIIHKYWLTIGQDNWVFGESKEQNLIRHHKTAIKRHIKVKGTKSPYDGDTLYWAKRKGSHPELKASTAKMLKKQQGKCNWCRLTFLDEDLIETDHIIPKAIGVNLKDNLQLLHKHCHDIKTKEDLKAIKKHKVKKEWPKTLEKFNKMNWEWVDDIPTLVKRYS